MRVTVTLALPSGATMTVQLPDDVPLIRLVPALVHKLELPLIDDAGRSWQYELVPLGQEPISASRTLAEVGLEAQAVLRLRTRTLGWAGVSAQSQAVNPLDAHLHTSTRRAAHRDAFQREQETDVGRRWLGIIVFLIYMGFRLLGGVFSDDPEPTLSVPDPPVATRRITPIVPTPTRPALPTVTPIPLPLLTVDSPVIMVDFLYYLYKDGVGYGLWRLDLAADGGEPERLLTVSDQRETDRQLVVREDMLYLPVGEERAIWQLPAGSDQPSPVRIGERLLFEPPVVLGDYQLFRDQTGGTYRPLYVAMSAAITGTTVISLPVMVGPDWQAHQVLFNGILYFPGLNDDSGLELWRSDGTGEGTYLLRDIYPGPSDSDPEQLVATTDYIYFTAWNGNAEQELWRSDGQDAEQLTDLRGGADASPRDLTLVAGELIFTARALTAQRAALHLYGTTDQPALAPLDYDANDELVAAQMIVWDDQFAFLVRQSGRTPLTIYNPRTRHSRQLLLPTDDIAQIYSAGAHLLVRSEQGYWSTLAERAAIMQPLTPGPGPLVAVVAEEVGSTLLIDQHATLWRFEVDGALTRLTQLAGTN